MYLSCNHIMFVKLKTKIYGLEQSQETRDIMCALGNQNNINIAKKIVKIIKGFLENLLVESNKESTPKISWSGIINGNSELSIKCYQVLDQEYNSFYELLKVGMVQQFIINDYNNTQGDNKGKFAEALNLFFHLLDVESKCILMNIFGFINRPFIEVEQVSITAYISNPVIGALSYVININDSNYKFVLDEFYVNDLVFDRIFNNFIDFLHNLERSEEAMPFFEPKRIEGAEPVSTISFTLIETYKDKMNKHVANTNERVQSMMTFLGNDKFENLLINKLTEDKNLCHKLMYLYNGHGPSVKSKIAHILGRVQYSVIKQ